MIETILTCAGWAILIIVCGFVSGFLLLLLFCLMAGDDAYNNNDEYP
jgi:hypothetical protein